MKKITALLLVLPLLVAGLFAQKPFKPTAADIHQSIRKLNVLGSVLYVAAHPDDENQRFISYFANERLYNVTYLSLTRGDGGQNLIGPELREMLGVLRTEELLMARSVDGGTQRFSRANDFGFSKNPEETMRIWNKDEVLADVVWQFRQQQPDVVVNRFYHDKKYDTHGHHTASAILSVEAFDLSNRTDVYPEQLRLTQPWQPRRIFFNTSWWFFGSREAFEKTDKSNLWAVDLGVFLPLKGKSNNELAAEARSMHRCQGFGSMGTRGESIDYFDFIKGDKPTTQDMFEGINTTWTRVEGGAAIGKLLAKVEANFNYIEPSASVPDLVRAMQMIKALPDGYWKRIKLAEIKNAIKQCMAIYLEASAADASVTPGEQIKIKLECINRTRVPATLAGVSITPALFDTIFAKPLEYNKAFFIERKVVVSADAPFTAPYWLQSPYSYGMYTVEDQMLRGIPETPRYARVRWNMSIGGEAIEFETDVVFKKEEPAIGEVYQPFEVLPPVFVEFGEQSYLFSEKTRDVLVRIKSGKENLSGSLAIETPEGWVVSAAQSFELKRKGEERSFTFKVTAPEAASEGQFKALATVGGVTSSKKLTQIRYDHIPLQSVLMPATAHAARLDVKTSAKKIGYIMGAGDEVPAALQQIGCTVTQLNDQEITLENLQKFEAVVVGIRAYNTKDELKFRHQAILDYAQNGGTVVLQYNTTGEIVVDQIAPFPMKLGRTRVTDENAEIRFLLPDHAVLNYPNKLTAKDFDGWIQERGLYFPVEWDATNFAAPISCNDPGEKPADGAILVARHGKGWFVYTGISFFRELPTGVPGAMRLFANLISLGKRA